MMKVIVGYPNRTEERAILDAMAVAEPSLGVQPVVSTQDIINARRVVSGIYVDDKVKDYIVDIVLATRDPKPYGIDLKAGCNTVLRRAARSVLRSRPAHMPSCKVAATSRRRM